ncbi:MAG: cytochrome c biogenesis protein CcdA [bacterium]|nr:cytochrome c biogenesis protein CcdA [bacterium]
MFESATPLAAFVAGFFTFFAPCTLPLIPAFLGIMAGVGVDDRPEGAGDGRRWRIFYHAIWYVLGFSLVFIAFGLAVSWIGVAYGFKQWTQVIGGILVMVFGFGILGLIPGWKGSFSSFGNLSGKLIKPGKAWGAFATGVLFAIGWSPCVGPLVGSILLLASSSGTVVTGSFLLVVFSAGLALPFLLTALLLDKAVIAIEKWGSWLRVFNRVVGVFLIILGVLMIAGRWSSILNSSRGLLEHFQFYEVYINRFL